MAALGGEVEVPTLDGREFESSDRNTNRVFRMRQGVQSVWVVVLVIYSGGRNVSHLSSAKELLREFEDAWRH